MNIQNMPPNFWESWLQLFYIQVRDKYNHTLKLPTFPSKKLAVIVEPRNSPLLRYVLYNFAYLLIPLGWHFQLFHGTDNKTLAEELKNELAPNLSITNLNTPNLSIENYNVLLTTPSFYDTLVSNPENILIFQIDCILLKNTVDKFLEYDMVGAPWVHTYGCNGGLSLRRVSAIKRVLQTNPWVYDNEDGFFSHRYASQLNIPDRYTLSEFSAEKIWSDDPVGLHKTYDYQSHNKLINLLEKTWKRCFS